MSHPQVHTRERLVEQRHREQEWLLAQFQNVGAVGGTFQGLRDFRTFAGFYNELAASWNPVQGGLDRLANRQQESALSTALWNQQTEEVEARARYLDTLKRTSGPAEPPVVGDGGGGGAAGAANEEDGSKGTPEDGRDGAAGNGGGDGGSAAPAPLPPVKAPLSAAAATLPSPSNLVESKAKPHPLDVFHDQLAYRDAINAALKANQLDDSHDFAGQMLYELTMSVSLAPGTASRRFAQVELELAPPEPDVERRVEQLARLYENWVEELQVSVPGEIGELQRRIAEDRLSDFDRRTLLWFIESFGPGLLGRMEAARQSKDQSELLALDRYSGKACAFDEPQCQELAEILRAFDAVPIRRVLLGSARSSVEPDVADRPRESVYALVPVSEAMSAEKTVMLMKGAAYLVWGTHLLDLGKLVQITAPTLNDATGYLEGGCLVSAQPSFYRPTDKARPTERDAALSSRYPEMPSSLPFGDSGAATFARRLLALEASPHALTVYPKEHAQSISEATARETALNLLLALSAVVPNAGAQVSNNTQFVRRTQEALHAIARQPLLVGYGDGGGTFGWFLGPSFKIEGASSDFLHRVIRHDVAATVVLPAWLDKIKLRGRQSWIDWRGRQVRGASLWNGADISLNVRSPENVYRHITQALVAHGIAGGAYRQSSRPHPVIEYPAKGDVVLVHSVPPATTASVPQELLVLGRDMWRNPQVFLGSARADSVEVLSNMEGLLARFDRVQYPGPADGRKMRMSVPVDLTVVTSFGVDRLTDVVRVLPPAEPAERGRLPAQLVRTHVDDVETGLVFRLDRPAAYGAIRIALKRADRPEDPFVELGDVSPAWSRKEGTVSFDLKSQAAPAAPQIWVADLRVYPRSDSDAGMVSLTPEGARFAWFAKREERSFLLTSQTIEYDVDGRAKATLDLQQDPTLLDAFDVAYPGLRRAGAVRAHAILGLGTLLVAIDLEQDPVNPAILRATEAALEWAPVRDTLLSDAAKGQGWQVAIGCAERPDPIPVLRAGKPATVQVSQDVLPDPPAFTLRDAVVRFKADPSLEFQTTLQLTARFDPDVRFKHKDALIESAAFRVEVLVVAEGKRTGATESVRGALMAEGKSFVISIGGVADATVKSRLLEWTKEDGVVVESVKVLGVRDPIPVKSATGGEATLRFEKAE